MLTTLLTFIMAVLSAVLLCAVIYLLVSKNKIVVKKAKNLQLGEIPNYHILGQIFWKVINTSNNAILLLQDQKIVNCNKKALAIFDAGYDYMIGKTPFALSPEYQPDGERSDVKGIRTIEEIFKKGIVNFEWIHKKRNNVQFIAEISATSFEEDGQYYVAVTMRDITQQKNEKQELTNYRLQLEKIVNEKTALLKDSNNQLNELNQELDAANEELKANNEELLCTNEHLQKEIHEHQKTQAEKAIAEEKIKQFIHQSGNGIIIINSQGIIEEWNEAMTHISGIDKAQAVSNFIWNINAEWSSNNNKEAEVERFKKYTMNIFANIIKGKAELYSFETQIKHTTLGDKYVQIFMYPIVTSKENYAGCIIIDITQKKATEAELDKYKTELETLLAKNSERLMQVSGRFSEVYNVSSDAITFIDIEDDLALKIFDMNPAAQKVFNITSDHIKKGIYAKDLLPPEKLTPFIEKVIPLVLQGETFTFTDDYDIGHGYWKSTIYPIKDVHGKITRIASISKNISAEKQFEKATALLNIAIESWPNEIWVADNTGKCILQNKAALSMWGNMVGVPLEDSNLQEDFIKASIIDSQKALGGETVSSEFVLDTPAGKRFVLFNLYPIRIANQLNGYMGIGIDITERKLWEEKIKASEEKYRLLAENIDDVIWKMDLGTRRYTYISPSMVKLSGYSAEEAVEFTMDQILTPEAYQEVLIDLDQRIKDFSNNIPEARTRTYEYEIRHKNGNPVWVEMNTTFIADSSGNAKEIIATSRNISERKKHESILLKSVINTEERERLHFSQELHDGLGPLLSAAKMYVDWLDKPNANINKEEIIPDIKNLLDEAAQSIRKISFKLSPHILQNYGILEALKAYSEKVKEAAKIEISIIAPEIPRFSEISETIIYRVLCECINNTIKHAKAATIHIVFAKSSNQLAVNYSDDGVGFDLPTVMNKRKGIGLLNMQSRLKSIDGEFNINTTPGRGTNIFLKINTDKI